MCSLPFEQLLSWRREKLLMSWQQHLCQRLSGRSRLYLRGWFYSIKDIVVYSSCSTYSAPGSSAKSWASESDPKSSKWSTDTPGQGSSLHTKNVWLIEQHLNRVALRSAVPLSYHEILGMTHMGHRTVNTRPQTDTLSRTAALHACVGNSACLFCVYIFLFTCVCASHQPR